MKPVGNYDYKVTYWLTNFGVISNGTVAPDAVTAINNVADPIKAKYGADFELIIISAERKKI